MPSILKIEVLIFKQQTQPKMFCNARILTTPYKLGDTTLYDSAECKKPATKHVWVDEDARMFICTSCLNRWITKKQTDTNWYGWFDCEPLPNTPAAESPFYIKTLQTHFGNLPLPQLRKKFLEQKN
jgi:hypothetical protein